MLDIHKFMIAIGVTILILLYVVVGDACYIYGRYSGMREEIDSANTYRHSIDSIVNEQQKMIERLTIENFQLKTQIMRNGTDGNKN